MSKHENIVLNGEQEAALGVMMSGANVFLTGEAGTGKSTLVQSIRSGLGVNEEEFATIKRFIARRK